MNELKLMAEHFLCPILQEMMQDPVMAADGHTYERQAIETWIKQKGGRALSPATGLRLDHHELQTNFLIKKMIEEYKSIKPRLKKKELDEKSIALAIQLRQEELDEFLKKKDRQLSLLSEEHEEVKEKLGPLNRKIRQLEKEREKQNEKLKLNLYKDNNIEDKDFTDHLIKIKLFQQETEALTKKQGSNVIKRAIASYIIHKRLKQTLLHKTIKKLSNDITNSKQKIMGKINEIQKASNQKTNLLKREYDQQSSTIKNEIKKVAEMGQYDKLGGLSLQGTTLDSEYAIKVQLLKNEQDENIKLCENKNQKNTEQAIFDLREKKLAQNAKQDDVNKRATRIAFFTNAIEKEKQLLLEVANKQKNQHKLFMLHAKKKSDVIINKFNRKPKEPLFKTSQESVTYQAQQVAKKLKPKDITAFLKLVYEGDLDGAELMLQKTPTLAQAQGDIEDLCGRKFNNITGLQYATWCLDAEMEEMIYKTLLPEQAALQWDALENNKDIEKKHGKRFSFEGLLKAYETFYNHSTWENCLAIGKEQQKVPAWYIYAFSEEGKDVAWVKQNFNLKIKREVAKNHAVNWTVEIIEGGECGETFCRIRTGFDECYALRAIGAIFLLDGDSRCARQIVALQQELSSKLQANCKNALVINEKLIGSGGLKKN